MYKELLDQYKNKDVYKIVTALEVECYRKYEINDDLQCDYEWDWDMPVYKNGETAFVEFCVEDKNYTEDAEYLYFEAKIMNKEIKKSNLILGDIKEE